MAKCDGHSLVVKVGNINLLPSSREEASEYPGDLLISLGVQITISDVIGFTGIQEFPADLMPATPDHMTIAWPDMSVPLRLNAAWWDKFITWLTSLPEQDVVIHCQGGHGRTGTALAIILGLTDEVERSLAGNWVQKNYCSHAIESNSQIDYIEDILGVKQVNLHPYKPVHVLPNVVKSANSVSYQQSWGQGARDSVMDTTTKDATLWPPVYGATIKQIAEGKSKKVDGQHILKPEHAVQVFYEKPENKINFNDCDPLDIEEYYTALQEAGVAEHPKNLDTYIPLAE